VAALDSPLELQLLLAWALLKRCTNAKAYFRHKGAWSVFSIAYEAASYSKRAVQFT